MLAFIRKKIREEGTVIHTIAKSADDLFYKTLSLGGTVMDRAIVSPLKRFLVVKDHPD